MEIFFHGQAINLLDEATKLVEDAKNIINKEDKWCKGSYAKRSDIAIAATNSTHDKACAWCATGAIIKAFSNIYKKEYSEMTAGIPPNDYLFLKRATSENIVFGLALRFLADNVDPNKYKRAVNRILDFNDHDAISHKDIIKLFNKTIEEMKTHEGMNV